jgi:hypothetical protein
MDSCVAAAAVGSSGASSCCAPCREGTPFSPYFAVVAIAADRGVEREGAADW